MGERSKVFIDSSYIIALYNERDSQHGRALVAENKLREAGSSIVVSNFVVGEVVTVLSQRVNREMAVVVGDYLQSDLGVLMMCLDAGIQVQSWNMFKNLSDKNVSFVDCSIVAAMQSEHIKSLLTFDKHFQKLRRFYNFGFFV